MRQTAITLELFGQSFEYLLEMKYVFDDRLSIVFIVQELYSISINLIILGT